MSGYTVNTGDLNKVASALNSASSEVARLQWVLSGQAHAPTSSSVIGSAGTASKYTAVLQEWTRNLGAIVTSLESMSKAMSATASVYEQTETNNTVKP